jgi:hypothetical protein
MRRKNALIHLAGGCAVLSLLAVPALATVIGFEEFAGPPYELGPESYWNGADGSGGFASGGALFNNSYTDWGGGLYSWGGWAVSNTTDVTTPGYENQYSAYTGVGADGSAFYGVGFVDPFSDIYPIIELPAGAVLESAWVTNTTYAALSMRDGDAVAKKFGGGGGSDPDWFKLTITGLDEAETPLGEVEFYLADYRFDDGAEDYILDDWATVDLSSIASARKLTFDLSSSDVGPFGINTPAYFAFDGFTFVPEPSAVVLVGLTILVSRRLGRA